MASLIRRVSRAVPRGRLAKLAVSGLETTKATQRLKLRLRQLQQQIKNNQPAAFVAATVAK